MHGFDVQVERKIPILVGAIENRTLVHIAGAIDQNVERAKFGRYRGRKPRYHPGPRRRAYAACRAGPAACWGQDGRDQLGAFGGEFLSDGAANSLACRGHQRDLSFQSVHTSCLFNVAKLCFCRPSASKFSGASQRSKFACAPAARDRAWKSTPCRRCGPWRSYAGGECLRKRSQGAKLRGARAH